MSRTTIEVEDVVRDELRSYKADNGFTYDEAILQLLQDHGWTPRHIGNRGQADGNEINDGPHRAGQHRSNSDRQSKPASKTDR